MSFFNILVCEKIKKSYRVQDLFDWGRINVKYTCTLQHTVAMATVAGTVTMSSSNTITIIFYDVIQET